MNTKKTNSKAKTETLEFKAEVFLGKNITMPIEFKMKTAGSELSLVYDDVVDSAYKVADKKFPPSDFPKMEVREITIKSDGGFYPVVAESAFKKSDYYKHVKKVLVLPEYTYSIHPDYKKYMELRSAGIINFEYDSKEWKDFLKLLKKTKPVKA